MIRVFRSHLPKFAASAVPASLLSLALGWWGLAGPCPAGAQTAPATGQPQPAAAANPSWGDSIKTGASGMKARFEQWSRNFRERRSQAAAERTARKPLLPPQAPAQQAQPAQPQVIVPVAERKPVAAGEGATRPALDWRPKMFNPEPPTAASAIRGGLNAERRGDIDGAIRWYETAVKLAPSNREARAKLVAAHAAKKAALPAPADSKPGLNWFRR